MDEALVALDHDGTLKPALANSWKSPDEETWVFELRPHVLFHDGHELTAEDVARSLEHARSAPGSKVRGYLASVAAIEAPSETTLRLKTRTRDPLLLNRLASIPVFRAGEDGRPPAGTGPYRIVRWVKGSHLEAEAFPGYWGGPPAIARVEFLPLRDDEAVVAALAERRVDVARSLTSTAADRLRGARGVTVVSRAGLWNRFLFLGTLPLEGGARSPLGDRRVRHAISLALDRKELAARVGGGAVPASQLPPPGVFGYQSGAEPVVRDVAAARRLLVEAGFAGGLELPLAYAPALANATAAAEVKRMLAEAGIRVTPAPIAREDLFKRWQEGKLPIFLAAWLFDSLDATSFLRDCVATRDAKRGIGTYNAGFSSPALDRLIEENAATAGDQRRALQYRELMKAVDEELPIVPLYTEGNLFAVSDRVAFTPRLDGRLVAFEMSFR